MMYSGCLKSHQPLLTSHKIWYVPDKVKKVVLRKMSRVDKRERPWQQITVSVLCNLHYDRGVALDRDIDMDRLPVCFVHCVYRSGRQRSVVVKYGKDPTSDPSISIN